MIPAQENLKQLLKDLEKARDVLRYSYEKCRRIQISSGLSYEEMESFEALTSRFALLSDIIIQKVIRALTFWIWMMKERFAIESTGLKKRRSSKERMILLISEFYEMR